MTQSELLNLISQIAESEGVDGNLATAICMVESNAAWPRCSTRFEPNFSYFCNPEYFSKINGITADTEKREQATSWGPMHIMGAVLRELGYEDPLPTAFEPKIAVTYACRKIKRIEKTYEAEDAVIAAYNGGSARRIPAGQPSGGKWANQEYVDRVQEHLKRLRMIR